jgi:hypothetical protein
VLLIAAKRANCLQRLAGAEAAWLRSARVAKEEETMPNDTFTLHCDERTGQVRDLRLFGVLATGSRDQFEGEKG